jgi:ankyrin repeat protein
MINKYTNEILATTLSIILFAYISIKLTIWLIPDLDPNFRDYLRALQERDTEKIEHLVKSNALKKNQRYSYWKPELGFTALHGASSDHNYQAMQILLNHGFDPNIADNCGHTPLMMLMRNEPTQDVSNCIQLLLDSKGIDINFKSNNTCHVCEETALTIAVDNKYKFGFSYIDLLANAGVDFNLRTNCYSPIEKLVVNQGENDEGIKRLTLLLKYGANPFIRNSSGESSYDIALRLHKMTFAKIILANRT